MSAESHGEIDSFLRSLFLPPRRQANLHAFRANILETGTVLEQAIDEVLASSVSHTAGIADQLRADVYWRLPIPVRIGLLESLLDERGMTDSFPLLCPVLKRFFDMRHLLAHGVVDVDMGRRVLLVDSVKRGRRVRRAIPSGEVAWLSDAAGKAQVHLARVWAGVVPSTIAWHDG